MTSLWMQRGLCLRHQLMGLYIVSRVHSSVQTHWRRVWNMAAFTYLKSSGTFGCKKKKKNRNFSWISDSAKLKCHNRGSRSLDNNFKWLRKRPHSLDSKWKGNAVRNGGRTPMKRWIFWTTVKFICSICEGAQLQGAHLGSVQRHLSLTPEPCAKENHSRLRRYHMILSAFQIMSFLQICPWMFNVTMVLVITPSIHSPSQS